uniref:Uncharacterized protein n=1 Tax=Fundulus heteroclitus TaxID=8078 RepID=A0A3Q2NRV9_FUNHE
LKYSHKSLSDPGIFSANILLNVSNTETYEQLLSTLNSTSYPLQLDNNTEIQNITVTTVCVSTDAGFQCECEEEFAWPYSTCITYGACDPISNGICKCISGIPADGSSCQLISELLIQTEYEVDLELNLTDIATVDFLRSLLNNNSFFTLDAIVNVTQVNFTTVCSPSSGDYQCRCEDQYRWPCDQCLTYGSCDNITDETCGCISAIPANGQYCQSLDQHTPPVIYEHILSVITVMLAPLMHRQQCYWPKRSVWLSVCSPINTTYQCRCEDQYGWPCDMCSTFGKCSDILDNTCGCINALPPNNTYCQPLSVENYSYSPPVVRQYLLSFELKTKDVRAVEQLRNFNYTISTNSLIQITGVNISTVCSPNNTTYQCRCEDQYGWPCDMCSTFGKCSDILDNTCGCINALPPNNTYCQPLSGRCISVTPQSTTVNTTTPVSSTILRTTNNSTVLLPATNATINTTISILTVTSNTVLITKNTTTTSTVRTTTKSPTSPTPTTTTSTSTKATTTAPTIATNATTATTKAPTTTTKAPTTTTKAPTTTTKAPTTTTKAPTTTTKATVVTSTAAPPATTATGNISDKSRFVDAFVTGIRYVALTVLKSECGVSLSMLLIIVLALICFHRAGSVVVDFTVRSSQFDDSQIAAANQNLNKTMSTEIAPVLGIDVPEISSEKPITLNGVDTYTGQTMILTCDPPGFNLINNVKVEWKFKERVISSKRHIISSNSPFTLTVNNVILADAGNYQCTLRGQAVSVHQYRNVGIKSAPNVQVQGRMFAQCVPGGTVPIECCVQSPYKVNWFSGSTALTGNRDPTCITYQYRMQSCSEPKEERFTCKAENPEGYQKETRLTIFLDPIICNDVEYGAGRANDIAEGKCEEGQTGTKTAKCLESGKWKLLKDTCIVTAILELQDLKEENVLEFTGNLSKAVDEEEGQITKSSATISAIVDILNTIADVSKDVKKDVMQNVLDTVDVIISDDAKDSWNFLNSNQTQNSSSQLLGSLETISERLNGTFEISTQRIELKRATFRDTFKEELNSTVSITIPSTGLDDTFITTILFSTLNNVMPARNSSFVFTDSNTTSNETKPENAINAAVLLVKINEKIRNVSLSYNKRNTTLELDPQCVFWNFNLLGKRGAWDDEGCEFVSDINDTVTCTCNHLTSFSILMSTNIPESIRILLDIMTYIGVGISMISLLICLIIEAIVWRALTKNSTAFMRHVAIVNTALSLLIADICFIIGASIAKNPKENPDEDYYKVPVGPCSAATFFMHFFYLAMFFWMFVSSLLLLYRTVMVFSQMSKWAMFAIGLTMGYVCPLIIAVTTVAATAPGNGYVREDQACWLNWKETKALLALVIPALTIVVFNILVIIVVLYKMLRRRSTGNTAQADEKHALVVIIRCVAILTPLFGLTWCLGIGTMLAPTNEGIHIAFAFFNSLQGFFILVFGTLFDSKVC